MTTLSPPPVLELLLDPVARCLTPDALRQLVAVRADANVQERLEVLADSNTEGLLTADEREEYETLVHAIQVVSILQAKAVKLLATSPAQ